MITLIAAANKKGVIGKDNQLLWHIPKDLSHFKQHTLNKRVVMGRKTFDSLGQRPLPKRHNIVISRSMTSQHENVEIVSNIALLKKQNEETFIIGGQQIYQEFMSVADRIILSLIYDYSEGDTYFPEIDLTTWAPVSFKTMFPEHAKDKLFKIIELQRK